jgi:molybdate transport system substrate-binding protein
VRAAVTVVVLLLAASCGLGGGDGSELVVFAASSLTEAAEELVAAQSSDGGRPVELVLGGSAALAAQIRDGAPADVFLSADRRWADEVAGHCAPACSVRAFATNSLVLAVPAGNPAGVRGLEDLSRSDLLVVLCDQAVPCGQLGERVTTSNGVTPDPDSLVSSVRAVRTLLELDEADAGLIYVTDVTDAVDIVPDHRVGGSETIYFHVVLDPDDPGSKLLTDFISGPSGQEILERLGFGPVMS